MFCSKQGPKGYFNLGNWSALSWCKLGFLIIWMGWLLVLHLCKWFEEIEGINSSVISVWELLLPVKLPLSIMSIPPVCTSPTTTFAPCSDHWGLEVNKLLSLELAFTWSLLEGGSIVNIGVPSM